MQFQKFPMPSLIDLFTNYHSCDTYAWLDNQCHAIGVMTWCTKAHQIERSHLCNDTGLEIYKRQLTKGPKQACSQNRQGLLTILVAIKSYIHAVLLPYICMADTSKVLQSNNLMVEIISIQRLLRSKCWVALYLLFISLTAGC